MRRKRSNTVAISSAGIPRPVSRIDTVASPPSRRAVSLGLEVFMECKIVRLLHGADGAVNGAVGFWRESGRFVVFGAKAVVLATGGVGKAWKFTSNSWECTGDGITLGLDAGADLIDMECIQFHPTGMVWPTSVRGILVTEGVRGDGGTLKNSEGARFMFNYIPEYFKGETADNEKEADAWYEDKKNNRRTPDLLPRDEVAPSNLLRLTHHPAPKSFL